MTNKVLLSSVFSVLFALSGLAVNPADYEKKPEGFPYYTGKVFPEAQKAVYKETFLPLEKVSILAGKGLDKEDIILNTVRNRIQECGGKVGTVKSLAEAEGVLISIGDNEGCEISAPEKPQGYAISVIEKNGRKIICLKGHDLQGNLWAASSFNQLVKTENGKPFFREAEISDWPDVAKRGFISAPFHGDKMSFSWLISCKINMVSFSSLWRPLYRETWRNGPTDLQKSIIENMGRLLSPLEIEWYASIAPMGVAGGKNYIFECSDEKDFQIIHDYACLIAKNKGGLYLALDDFRIPITEADMKKFGSAREADIYFITRLYKTVKAQFPEFRMLVCPPFYWGPDSGNTYSENREDYLKAVGDRLDPEIKIFWSGPRVKSREVNQTQVKWISDLIKRKPVFWQNTKDSPHADWACYVGDEYDCWGKWHYQEFFDDVDAYLFNANGKQDYPAIATLSDYLWNRKAYTPAGSTRTSVAMMFGPEALPLYKDLNQKLSTLDTYGFYPSPGAGRNLKSIRENMRQIGEAYKKAYAYNPDALTLFSGMVWYNKMAERFVKALESNPKFESLSVQAAESMAQAEQETGLKKDRDTFLSAVEFDGGQVPRVYGYVAKEKEIDLARRLCTWINGAKTTRHSMKASFTVEPFPPSADYKLIISGANDDSLKPCKIKIAVNDIAVFEGASPFSSQKWSVKEFKVPATSLSQFRNSTLTVSNMEDTDNLSGPPFFLLNYAVLRKTAE